MAKITEIVDLKVTQSGDAGSVKSLRGEIEKARAEAVGLARAFGEFSPEATQAAAKVAELRKEMGDFQQRVQALSPDKFQTIARVASGIAGGFAAAQGAMALLGVESEDLQKTMVKLQAVMALSQGIQGLTDLKQGFGALVTMLKSAVIPAFYSTAAAARLIGQALGVGIIIAGITAVVGWMKKLGDETENTKQRVAELKDEFERDSKAISDLTQIDILNAKKRGESEQELQRIRQKGFEDQLMSIETARKRAKDDTILQKEENDIRKAMALSQAQFEADQAEKSRDRKKQAIEDQKKHNEDLLKLDDEFRAAMEESINEQEKAETEFSNLVKKNERELADIKDGAMVAEVRSVEDWFQEQKKIYQTQGRGIEELVELRNVKVAAIEKKYDDEKKAADQKKADEELAAIIKENDKKIDEELRVQQALVDARQFAFDSTSQLLGAVSELFAQGSAAQKAFAIAQVAFDEARAIASVIAGATQAAAAGGPAAPFLIAGYIASGLATVAASFKKVKDILGTTQQTTSVAQASATLSQPIISGQLPGSDQTGAVMEFGRVYVLEGDITRTQGRVRTNKNVAVV